MPRSAWWLPILVLAGAAPAHAARPDPLVVLASGSGRIEVLRAGTRRIERLTLGAPLFAGDKLRVGSGARATLLYRDGRLVPVPEGRELPIGRTHSGPPGTPRLAGVFDRISRVEGDREGGLVSLPGPTRHGEVARGAILSPRAGAVLDPRPAFRWRAVAGADRYRVVLFRDDRQLWSRETRDTTLAYPADSPDLEPGAAWVWELHAADDRGTPPSREEAAFFTPAAARADTVRGAIADIGSASEARDRRSLEAAYLESEGFLAEAAERLAALTAESPDDAGLHEALGRVYQELGLMDLAAAELQRALRLVRTR